MRVAVVAILVVEELSVMTLPLCSEQKGKKIETTKQPSTIFCFENFNLVQNLYVLTIRYYKLILLSISFKSVSPMQGY